MRRETPTVFLDASASVDRGPEHTTGWLGTLDLRYERTPAGTRGHHRHEGPLRVLKALYPEGPAICHHVLLHPPAGIVGGDELRIHVDVQEGAHALATAPGATRFYRSAGPWARQRVEAHVRCDARWEWVLPETIVYPGARAASHLTIDLAPGASMIGCDVVVLGLTASDLPFTAGCFEQRIEVVGAWLEHGLIRADDERLLNSPLGLAGHAVMGTAWLAHGEALSASDADHALSMARSVLPDDGSAWQGRGVCGVSALHPRVIVARVLAATASDAWSALRAVRAAWRQSAWQLRANEPRIWSV